MNKYTFQIFDTRNTCTEKTMQYSHDTQAILSAKLLSENHHHIIVNNENGAFETYEKGKITEWSFPNGLGQIKRAKKDYGQLTVNALKRVK